MGMKEKSIEERDNIVHSLLFNVQSDSILVSDGIDKIPE